jgi:hypothetical protein
VKNELRAQALPVLTLLAFLVGVSVVLQLWLLGASLEGVLGGRGDIVLPAACASLVLFVVNLGLLAYVLRVDRHTRLSPTLTTPPGRSGGER